MPSRSVSCLVTSRDQADQVLRRIRTAGFSSNDISALFPSQPNPRASAPGKNTRTLRSRRSATLAPTAWRSAFRSGFATIGTFALPGRGPLVASGPIVFALSSDGGGIAGGLLRLGIPELEARRYAGKIRGGNILISVRTHNREEMLPAQVIFKEANAQDICTTAGSSSAKDTPATEHPSGPSKAAYSRARV